MPTQPLDLDALFRLRSKLHRCPEVADQEQRTAEQIASFLSVHTPDRLTRRVGGYGLLATYEGPHEGPTVLVRCELDALPPGPADEGSPSGQPGAEQPGHRCGHDGHMAMVCGLAMSLAARRPLRGRVVLLFQPAEETGGGARRVLEHAALRSLDVQRGFALHNVPGYALGEVLLREGPCAPASVGLEIELRGRRAHAGEPEAGLSPAYALAAIINGLGALPTQTRFVDPALITVVGARLGQRAFGTAPGHAWLWATLRALRPEPFALLRGRAAELVAGIVEAHGLSHVLSLHDEFPPTINDAGCVGLAASAAADAGLPSRWLPEPFGWSEDFGAFGARFPCALVGLGSGEEQPALHDPRYEFPDALLPQGVSLLTHVVRHALAASGSERLR